VEAISPFPVFFIPARPLPVAFSCKTSYFLDGKRSRKAILGLYFSGAMVWYSPDLTGWGSFGGSQPNLGLVFGLAIKPNRQQISRGCPGLAGLRKDRKIPDYFYG
jgi:hypothetical protein